MVDEAGSLAVAIKPHLLSSTPGAPLQAAGNGYTRPLILYDATPPASLIPPQNPSSLPAGSVRAALTQSPPLGFTPPPPPPPSIPSASLSIRSPPSSLEESIRAVSDHLYGDQISSSQLGGFQATSMRPFQAEAPLPSLAQQLQAANALNLQLQADAVTQQLEVNSLNRQLNHQYIATSTPSQQQQQQQQQHYQQYQQYQQQQYQQQQQQLQQQQQQQQYEQQQYHQQQQQQQQQRQQQQQVHEYQQYHMAFSTNELQDPSPAFQGRPTSSQQQAGQQTYTSPPQQQAGRPSYARAPQQQTGQKPFPPPPPRPAIQGTTLLTIPVTTPLVGGAPGQVTTAVVTANSGGQLLITPGSMPTATGPPGPAMLSTHRVQPGTGSSAAKQAQAAQVLSAQQAQAAQVLSAQQAQAAQVLSQNGSAATSAGSSMPDRATKIKLLLSSGGQFEKCTETGSWEYHGGETRLVTVRHTSSFAQLLLELSKGSSTTLQQEPVQLKYELPGSPEVMVDLINDDDVDNMWEEWQSFTLTDKPSYKIHIYVMLLLPPSTPSRASGGSSGSRGSSASGLSTPPSSIPTPPYLPSSHTHDNFANLPPTVTIESTIASAASAPDSATISRKPRVDLCDLEGKIELISPNDLTVVRFLGAGGYGEVYLARWHSSDVAVKCLNPSLFSATEGRGSVSEEVVGELVKEANMLGSLRHPNVVWVYGLVLPTGDAMDRLKEGLEEGQYIDAVGFATTAANQVGLSPGLVRPPALVTEFLSGGSLRAVITRKEGWLSNRSIKIKIMLDTARGMEYLHSKRIVHFDLKSGNLLIGFHNRTPICKVADFGLSKQRQQTYVTGVTSMRGTLPWTAPEIIRNPKAVDEKVDIYSFGICMWEVWTGREPFEGINYHALLHMMTQQDGLRPPLPGSQEWDLGDLEEPAEGWTDLMVRCWADAPSLRPSFLEIVKQLQAMLGKARAVNRQMVDSA